MSGLIFVVWVSIALYLTWPEMPMWQHVYMVVVLVAVVAVAIANLRHRTEEE